jgi:hypothetical protein
MNKGIGLYIELTFIFESFFEAIVFSRNTPHILWLLVDDGGLVSLFKLMERI